MSSKYTFLQKVDQLSTGQKWLYDKITVTGDVCRDDGNVMVEHLDLWRRDPVECVWELIGNPAFWEVMCYMPEQLYADADDEEQILDEMWMADWWWNKQVSGSTTFDSPSQGTHLVCNIFIVWHAGMCDYHASNSRIGQNKAIAVQRQSDCVAGLSVNQKYCQSDTLSGFRSSHSTDWIHTGFKVGVLLNENMLIGQLSALPSLHGKYPKAIDGGWEEWCRYVVCWWLHSKSSPHSCSLHCRPSRTVSYCEREGKSLSAWQSRSYCMQRTRCLLPMKSWRNIGDPRTLQARTWWTSFQSSRAMPHL